MDMTGKTRLQVVVKEQTADKLSELAEQYGVSKGAMISVLVEQEWRKRQEGGG